MKWTNPKHNEIFWKNILKHNLTSREWKVLTAFVIDKNDFNAKQITLSKRTGIAQPNVNKILKTLVYLGILNKKYTYYKLSENILTHDYIPIVTSGRKLRKEQISKFVVGSGNFAKKSKIKRAEKEILEKAIKSPKEIYPKEKYYGFGNPDEYEINFEICRVYTNHDFRRIVADEETIRFLTKLGWSPERIKEFIHSDLVKKDYIKLYNLSESS